MKHSVVAPVFKAIFRRLFGVCEQTIPASQEVAYKKSMHKGRIQVIHMLIALLKQLFMLLPETWPVSLNYCNRHLFASAHCIIAG